MSDRPEVLLSRADYWEDIKARWQIHEYETKRLRTDLALVANTLTDSAYYTVTAQ